MPARYRTWGLRDRLTAPDLNAQFGLVAEGRMPGALCPSGATLSLPANVATEIPFPQPAEGDDPSAYWQSNGRLVIPQGLAGWHLLSFALSGLQGAPKGDAVRVTVNGTGLTGLVYRFTSTGAAGFASGALFSHTAVVAELTTLFLTVAADSATDVKMTQARIVRLASHGVYV